MINEKQVCVRDGEWKDCEVGAHLIFAFVFLPLTTMHKQGGHAPADFIRQIELEYDKLNAG